MINDTHNLPGIEIIEPSPSDRLIFKDGERNLYANSKNVLDAIDKELLDAGCKRTHIWNLFQVDRAGHSALDPRVFCALFGLNMSDIVILIPKGRKIANRAYLHYFCFGAHIIEVDRHELVYFMHVGKAIVIRGDIRYYFIGREVSEIYRQSLVVRGRIPISRPEFDLLSWNEDTKLRYNLDQTELVVIHNREPNWFNAKHHSHRDSSIESLIPAIQMLKNRGYRIVRIGDNSMKRLPTELDVVESPFFTERREFDDISLMSMAKFFIGTSSGPYAVAEVLGTPIFVHNCTSFTNCHSQQSEVLYKRYIRRSDCRKLSYFEMFTSWVGFCQESNKLDIGGIEVIPNSPEEILMGTELFLEDLQSNFKSTALDSRSYLNQAINDYNMGRGMSEFIFDPAYSQWSVPSRFYSASDQQSYFIEIK
jgi:putative glycosyltransferase (TIGR04372 family)